MVQSIIKHYESQGSLEYETSPGRPQLLSPLAKDRLIHAIKQDPKESFDVFGPLVGVSSSTARRVAEEYNDHARIAHQKCHISPDNWVKRLEWGGRKPGDGLR
jgi:transposase